MTIADRILENALYKQRGGLASCARQLDPDVRISGLTQIIGSSKKVYRFSDGSALEIRGRGKSYSIKRIDHELR